MLAAHCCHPVEWCTKSCTVLALQLFNGGVNFEVPTLPTLGRASRWLATISRLIGIYATSMKKESRRALLCCELVVVTRLLRLL